MQTPGLTVSIYSKERKKKKAPVSISYLQKWQKGRQTSVIILKPVIHVFGSTDHMTWKADK